MPIPRKQPGTQVRSKRLTCKVFDLGLDGFSECSEIGPNNCRFAVPFGYGFLCRHPDCQARSETARTLNSAVQISLNHGPV